MKIAEIEPYIDSLQLKKLEVKLEQGREVRMFICADNVAEYSERVYGDIVVFDSEGHAWKLDNQCWQKESGIDVQKVAVIVDQAAYTLRANNIFMKRVKSLDYKSDWR
jgi:hypothetical protein